MASPTFRDYAMAVMQGQVPQAIEHLQILLGLTAEPATTATAFFQGQAKLSAFLPKAMGLRAAVESGSDEDIWKILVDCFGLTPEQRGGVIGAVRVRYPRTTPTM